MGKKLLHPAILLPVGLAVLAALAAGLWLGVMEREQAVASPDLADAAATRTLNLSPAGWHSFVWTGASATDPATALACLGTNYTIAYEWVGSTQQWLRYVPGQPTLSSITVANKYDALLVYITAAVTCTMAI